MYKKFTILQKIGKNNWQKLQCIAFNTSKNLDSKGMQKDSFMINLYERIR